MLMRSPLLDGPVRPFRGVSGAALFLFLAAALPPPVAGARGQTAAVPGAPGPAGSGAPGGVPAAAAATRHVEPEARALLLAMADAHRGLKTYSATLEVKEGGAPPRYRTSLLWQPPNRAVIVTTRLPRDAAGVSVTTRVVSDGRHAYVSSPANRKRYVREPAPRNGSILHSLLSQSGAEASGPPPLLPLLLSGEGRRLISSIFAEGSGLASLRRGAAGREDGVAVETLIATLERTPKNSAAGTVTFVIGAKDRLLRSLRQSLVNESGGPAVEHTETYRNVRANPPAAFRFTPPPGAQMVVRGEPDASSAEDASGSPVAALLARMRAAYAGLRTFRCRIESVEDFPGTSSGGRRTGITLRGRGVLALDKPNGRARHTVTVTFGREPDGGVVQQIDLTADGRTLFVNTSLSPDRYLKQPLPATAGGEGLVNLLARFGGVGQTFSVPSPRMIDLMDGRDPWVYLRGRDVRSVTLGPPARAGGAPVRTVVLRREELDASGIPTGRDGGGLTLSIGVQDHLLRQVTETRTFGGRNTSVREIYREVQTNPDLPAALFTFTPPLYNNALADAVDTVDALNARQDFRPKVGNRAAAFEPAPVLTEDGGRASLKDYHGKVVLLHFWASWSPRVVAQIERLRALRERYKDAGFDILGVCLDEPGDRQTARALIAEKGAAWRQIFEGRGMDSAVASSYAVDEVPRSVLIGRDGRIVALDPDAGALESAVAAAIGTAAIPALP